MVIYRLTDRIPIALGPVKVWVAPLSFGQKAALSKVVSMKAGEEIIDGAKLAYLTVKFSVKEVEGLTAADGSPYALEFEADGSLTDDCVSEILQMDQAPKLAIACRKLLDEIKEHEIEGVTIDLKGVKSAKKKGA